MTPDQVQRLHYAALGVVQFPTFYDADGHIIVGIPIRIWSRLETVIDALPHPSEQGAPNEQ